MSSRNVIVVFGNYKITGTGGEPLDVSDYNILNDKLSMMYDGGSFSGTIGTIDAINDYNSFSISSDIPDLPSNLIKIKLRTYINNSPRVLLYEVPFGAQNFLEGTIDLGDINFIYDDSYFSQETDGCTNPIATNYNSCMNWDSGYPNTCIFIDSESEDNRVMGCNDPTACTCDNPLCYCQYCGTDLELICNTAIEEGVTVDSESIGGYGFYNLNSDGTGTCQYPIVPVRLGFANKFLDIDFSSEVTDVINNPDEWKNIPNGSTYPFLPIYLKFLPTGSGKNYSLKRF